MKETGQTADEIAETLGEDISESILEYARTTPVAEQSQEGLTASVNRTGNAFTAMGIKAKASAIKVGILNGVMNAGVGLLTGLVVSGVTSLIDYMIETPEEIAEAAEEAKERIEELYQTLDNKQNAAEELGQRFAELSEGIDLFTGENKSLSTEEYEEFLKLSNELAEVFPELERNYTSNGDAIIQLSGETDGMVASLNSLVEAQRQVTNQTLLKEMPAVFKSYSANIETYENKIDSLNTKIQTASDSLEYLLTAEKTYSGLSYDLDVSANYQQAKDMLEYLGLDYEQTIVDEDTMIYEYLPSNSVLQSDINSIISSYKKQIVELQSKIQQENNSIKQYMFSFLEEEWDYAQYSSQMQTAVQKMVGNIDWSKMIYNGETVKSWKQAEGYIRNNILTLLSKTSEISQQEFSEMFSFDLSTVPVGEFLDDYCQLVEKMMNEMELTEEQKIDFRIRFNYIVEDQQSSIQKAKNKIDAYSMNTNEGVAKNLWLNSLDEGELSLFLTLDVDKDTSLENLKVALEEAKKIQPQYSFVDITKTLEALDNIQSAYQTVSAAIQEYDSTQMLSLDTVQSLLQLDDKYLSVLYDENGQLQLNTDSYNNLTKAMLQQMQVDIISNAMATLSSLTDEQAAKEYLKNTTLDLTGAKWEDVYATIKLARAELLEAQARGEVVDSRIEALDRLESSTKAKEALFKEAEKSLRTSADNFYGATKTDSSETENVFDWAANSIANLNREIDNLNKKLGEASLEDKKGIYAQLEEKNEELVSATEKAAGAYENIWKEKSSKLSADQKKRIMFGDVFDISTFKGEKGQTEYQNLVDAQQAYEQWQSMSQQHDDAVIQKKNDQDNSIQNKIAIEEEKLATLEAIDKEKLTTKEKNKLLTQEMKIKGKILEYNKQLANTDEEKNKLQTEFDKEKEASEEEKYENEREERNNKVNYYDSRIKDVQNKIDLKELQNGYASKKDYEEMNGYLAKQLKLESDNYEAALAMRDAAKPGTDEWYEYNTQVQEAQDNINACTKAQIENNRAILELPIKALEEQNKELEKELENLEEHQTKVESAYSYATYLVQDEIDNLNKSKEAISDSYDEQIKAIEETKEALTEENDEKQRSIDLENAKYNLEKALRNKTIRIYRAGQGFVYEADQEEAQNAQDELDQQIYDNTIAELDKQIQTLNDEKEVKLEVLDNEIKLWEEYSEKLDKVSEAYDRVIAKRSFYELFGSSNEQSILNLDESFITTIGDELFKVNANIEIIQEKIKVNETTIAEIQEAASGYLETSTKVEAAQKRIAQLVLDNEDELKAIEDRKEKAKSLKEEWGKSETDIGSALDNIETANITAKDDEATTLDTRTGQLEVYKKEIVDIYGEIKKAVDDSNTAYNTMQANLAKAKGIATEINTLVGGDTSQIDSGLLNILKDIGIDLDEYHTGGIVGKTLKNNLPEHFIALADSNLKPNETLAKLLNGEVVLNTSQMGNMLNNLSRAYSALTTPPNKRENSPITVSIGDVNVYNPDNTDMIVNEIVKELPLKVVQRLYSK